MEIASKNIMPILRTASHHHDVERILETWEKRILDMYNEKNSKDDRVWNEVDKMISVCGEIEEYVKSEPNMEIMHPLIDEDSVVYHVLCSWVCGIID